MLNLARFVMSAAMGQADLDASVAPTTATEAAEQGMPGGVIIAILVGLGVLIVALHVFIAIWIARDARRKGRSAAGWAIFGAIPLIGLIGLFIYALLPSTRFCPRHPAVALPPDSNVCPVCVQDQRWADEMRKREEALQQAMKQISDLQKGLEDARRGEARPAPILVPDKDETQILKEVPRVLYAIQQINGQHPGRYEPIQTTGIRGNQKRVKIGRTGDCEIAIPEDDAISREHCCFFEEAGALIVVDMASGNGTFVVRDGVPLDVLKSGKVALQDGDVLRVGKTEFRVIITGPGELAPAGV